MTTTFVQMVLLMLMLLLLPPTSAFLEPHSPSLSTVAGWNAGPQSPTKTMTSRRSVRVEKHHRDETKKKKKEVSHNPQNEETLQEFLSSTTSSQRIKNLQTQANNDTAADPLYYLTLFILFDDYAHDVGWWLRLGDAVLIELPPEMEPYKYRSGGDSVTHTVSIDEFLSNRKSVAFRFVMMDSYHDGLIRGGYYQLNFTNSKTNTSTEIARASHYGRRSSVAFTIGRNSTSLTGPREARELGVVTVLDAQVMGTETPTKSPTAPPTPSRPIPFLRLLMNFPRVHQMYWEVSRLDPGNLNNLQRMLHRGSYNGRRDGKLHRVIPLVPPNDNNEEPSYFRFVLGNYELPVYQKKRLVQGNYSLVFVPGSDDNASATMERPLPQILSQGLYRDDHSVTMTIMVDRDGGSAVVLLPHQFPTPSPTVSPTFEPTNSSPPTLRPTEEGTLPPPFITVTTVDKRHTFLLWLFAVMIPLLLILLAIAIFYTRNQRQTESSARRNEAAAAGQTNNRGAFSSSNTTAITQENILVGGLPPQERFRYIMDNLLTVPIATLGPLDPNTSTSSLTAQCAICLAEFANGDQVCFSSNPLCEHKFHQPCMIAWLQQHVECPCCRQPYLKEPSQPASTN